jgi:hypothetical protein
MVDTNITKDAPKYYNLCSKGVLSNTPLSSKIVVSPSKITPPIPTQKPNTPTPSNNKPNTSPTINKPDTSQVNKTPRKPKTHTLEYNITGDLKKTKANISSYDICALPQQHELILDTFNPNSSQKKIIVVTEITSKAIEKKVERKQETKYAINAASIRLHFRSRVPPFLLTFEFFNFNVHNCLVDFGASSNSMPYSVFQRINVVSEKITTRIMQLDRSDVKVRGELKYVMIRIAYDPRVHRIIDIVVFEMRRDWPAKLQGYFSID